MKRTLIGAALLLLALPQSASAATGTRTGYVAEFGIDRNAANDEWMYVILETQGGTNHILCSGTAAQSQQGQISFARGLARFMHSLLLLAHLHRLEVEVGWSDNGTTCTIDTVRTVDN